jgi:AcrR family transcriptional regulator
VTVADAGRRSGAPAPPVPTRLLDAAERLFSKHGYAGTSVRDITRIARCNVAGVNYYFGGKDQLYVEVLARRLAALREHHLDRLRGLARIGAGEPPLETVLGAFVHGFISPFATNGGGRAIVELISREVLEPRLPPDMFRSLFAEPVERAYSAALCGAVGGLSPAAARRCVRSLVAQLLHEVHGLRRQGRPGPRSGLEDALRHIVCFSSGGVRACATREAR